MTIEIEAGTVAQDKPSILWDNIFERGTVTASSTAVDGDAANAYAEDTTFDFWTPDTNFGVITVDMGSDVECDCLGVAAHTLGTVGTEITVESSDNGSDWVIRGRVTPITDDTLMLFFPIVSARYWRVYMDDTIASIGVIKLGKRLIIPTGVLSGHTAINHAQEVELLNNMSVKGQFLGNRIVKLGAETSINFGMIEADFVDNDMAAFEAHYNEGRSFFYAGSPRKFPKDVGYCWRQDRAGTLRPNYQEGGELMQVELQVAAYVE